MLIIIVFVYYHSLQSKVNSQRQQLYFHSSLLFRIFKLLYITDISYRIFTKRQPVKLACFYFSLNNYYFYTYFSVSQESIIHDFFRARGGQLQSTQVTRERYFWNLNGVFKFTCQFRKSPTGFQSSHINFPSLLTVWSYEFFFTLQNWIFQE